MRRSLGLSILIAFASSAYADESPPESTVLFERARALVKEGRYAEACPLFAQSQRLAPGLGTELNLALCLAATAKLVEARAMLEALVQKTEEAGQPERAEIARKGLAEVMARMARVSIDASAIDATEIRIDGQVVATTGEIPIDPGPHRVEAAGAVTASFEAVEGELVEVRLLRVEEAPVVGRPRIIYYLGAGAAGALVFAAIGGIVALDKKSSGIDDCMTVDGKLQCTQKGLDTLASARTWSHVSTGFAIAGVGLAAATVYLELKYRDRRERRPVATTWVDASSVGVGVACAF